MYGYGALLSKISLKNITVSCIMVGHAKKAFSRVVRRQTVCNSSSLYPFAASSKISGAGLFGSQLDDVIGCGKISIGCVLASRGCAQRTRSKFAVSGGLIISCLL